MKVAKSTVCDILKFRFERSPKNNSIGWIENKDVHFYNFETYHNTIESISVALLSFNIKKNSKIALLSQTRKEWHLLDYGILCSGSITVPIYPSYQSEDILFILNHSETEVLVVENEKEFQKIIPICEKLTHLKRIFTIERVGDDLIQRLSRSINVLSFDELISHGVTERQSHPDLFNITIQNIQPTDIATIIYTSGTTGAPKGAVITHEALFQVLDNVQEYAHNAFNKEDRLLTYLPLAHVLARCESYLPVLFGCETVYAESIEKLLPNIEIAQPTLMTGVPRIFEKIYERVQANLEDNPIKKNLFDKAMKVANEYFDTIDDDRSPSSRLIIEYQLAKKLVFKNIYQKFGGKIRFFISGGAPLGTHIITFLRNTGLTVLEGYGLTETVAPCSLNPLNKQVIGSVGQPIGDVALKIATDGEILIKSKALFKEYYKNEKATADVFTQDGWFQTGDIGVIDNKGFLKITERKKDIIITSGGKNIAPQKIENLLKSSTLIAQSVVIGDKRKFLTALIFIDQAQIAKSFEDFEIPESSEVKDIVNHPEILRLFQNEIDQINEKLASFETIKKFRLLPVEISQENYLTPSLKIKRKVIIKDFEKTIDAMYKPM